MRPMNSLLRCWPVSKKCQFVHVSERQVTSEKNVRRNTVTSPQRHLLFTSWVSTVTSEKLTQSLELVKLFVKLALSTKP